MVPAEHERCPSHRELPSPVEADREARRWEALNMRRAGFSFRDIGERLDITRQAAAQMVNRCLSELAPDPQQVVELREMQRSRLERLLLAVWPQAIANPPDLDAHDRAHKLIQTMIRLDGLSTYRFEQSGPGGGPIPVQMVPAEDHAELLRMIEAELVRREAIEVGEVRQLGG